MNERNMNEPATYYSTGCVRKSEVSSRTLCRSESNEIQRLSRHLLTRIHCRMNVGDKIARNVDNKRQTRIEDRGKHNDVYGLRYVSAQTINRIT